MMLINMRFWLSVRDIKINIHNCRMSYVLKKKNGPNNDKNQQSSYVKTSFSRCYGDLVLLSTPSFFILVLGEISMTSPAFFPSLQVQQCWTLAAGASDAALLGVVGWTGPFLDCPQPHHHHRPGHQCLHHPRACLLLPNCHWAGGTEKILLVLEHILTT